ncbi:hypothetical protein [Chitinasiproducens palmae]|uniref:Uncharacterized protein n=1 Tax=Chitinasiproducens palmae TaxID=1770053 RepID=A0A1H2PQG7_9BURK|nr:hypothetical protein [Chitinasiproducens palmae]SDV49063.1 hypothetical protein SAMN05216551_10733 [Chitinasiproducens palmae]
MTIRIVSDANYTGPYALENLIDADPDYFKKRVLADGGTIINQAALDAAIGWVHAQGLSILDTFAASAAWGIKLDTDGTSILRVYSLDGNDLVRYGAYLSPQLDRTSFSFPIMRNVGNSATSGWLKSQASAYLATANEFCLGAAMYTEAGDDRAISCCAAIPASLSSTITTQPAYLIAQNNDSGLSRQVALLRPTTTTNAVQTATNDYVDFRAMVCHGNISAGTNKMFVGSQPATYLTTASEQLLDYTTLPLDLLCLAYGNRNNGVACKGGVREMWNIKKSTEQISQALAARLASL